MIDFSKFRNKKIAILWYGREGKSTFKFLLNIGIDPKNITILDGAKQIEWLAEHLLYLNKHFDIGTNINIIVGDVYLDSLKKFDIIIKTPGISIYHEKIYPHRKKITSQAQIFFDFYQGKIIAVSGTKGKSTTSTLIYEMLNTAGKKAQLIGNIGNPVLDYIHIQDPQSQQDEYAVYEVSSYMLEGLQKKNYISVLLNIYPEHLDRHQWFDNYQKAKLSLLYGSEHNLLRYEILKDNDLEEEDFKEYNVRMFGIQGKYTYHEWKFSLDKKNVFDTTGILLKWEHNMMNICAVIGVCDIMGIDLSILKTTIEHFKWIPHRMEIIGEYGWIIWIDDAISTIQKVQYKLSKHLVKILIQYFCEELIEDIHSIN